MALSPVVAKGYTSDDLVNQMKLNSPTIKLEKIKLEQSKLDHKKAIGDFFPVIEYSMMGAYIANPIKEITISTEDILNMIEWPQGVNPAVTPGTYIPIYDGMESSHYSFSLSLKQPISTWGKIVKQMEIYDELVNIQSNTLSFETKKAETEIRTRAEAYAYLMELEKTLERANKDAEELEELVESTTKEGMSTDKDYLTALASSKLIKYAYENVVAQKEGQVDALSMLTGIKELKKEDLNITPLTLDEYKKILEKDELAMIGAAIGTNKEPIQMLDSAVEIAKDQHYVSKVSMPYTPDIGLIASLSYSGPRFPFIEKGWSSSDDWNAIVGVSIKGTLFDGTKQFREKSKTKLGIEKAELEKEKNVQTIINNVKSTRREIKVLLISIEAKQAAVEEKQEALRIATDKYESRQITRLDYLKASLEEAAAAGELWQEYINLATKYYTLLLLT